jgi:hypothetical protein
MGIKKMAFNKRTLNLLAEMDKDIKDMEIQAEAALSYTLGYKEAGCPDRILWQDGVGYTYKNEEVPPSWMHCSNVLYVLRCMKSQRLQIEALRTDKQYALSKKHHIEFKKLVRDVIYSATQAVASY